jgi:hypothetical protein
MQLPGDAVVNARTALVASLGLLGAALSVGTAQAQKAQCVSERPSVSATASEDRCGEAAARLAARQAAQAAAIAKLSCHVLSPVQIASVCKARGSVPPSSAAVSPAARVHQRRADLPRAMHRVARGQPINPTDNLFVLQPSPDNPGDCDGFGHLRGGLPAPVGAALEREETSRLSKRESRATALHDSRLHHRHEYA